MSGLNAPDGAGCFPNHRRVVRCPAWGNGPRIATGPKAPLDRAAHRSLMQTLPSSRKGRHRRASKGSAPPDGDAAMRIRGAVPCSSDTSVQTWAVNREALARRPPGGMWSCGGRGASANEGGSGIPALVCPAGAHRGDAVVVVVPCSRLSSGARMLSFAGPSLVLGHFDAAFLPLVWPAAIAPACGIGW